MSNDEWETPAWLFDKLDAEFHFTLDAAANSRNHKCARWIGEKENGLMTPWAQTTWVNPPYSDQTPWAEKAKREADLGFTSVLLMMCDTSTQCFRYCATHADEIRLLDRRVKFVGAKGSPRFASMIVVFRPQVRLNASRPFHAGAVIQSWHINED